jgi:hypothetical protein
MLTLLYNLEPSAIERLLRWGIFAAPVAEDPDTGCQLQVSDGRRRAGRPARYYLTAPRVLLPAGYFEQTHLGTLTAYSDDEALAKARARLPKLLDAHRRARFPEQYLVNLAQEVAA